MTKNEPVHAMSRPPVSGLAAFLTGCAALTGVVVLGGIVVLSVTLWGALSRVDREQARQIERLDKQDSNLREAWALVDEVAEWIHAAQAREGRFPRALRERPPSDPWGNAIFYARSGMDRAELRSAGPDRELDTIDDLVRTLAPR
jgi:hypothetical protein